MKQHAETSSDAVSLRETHPHLFRERQPTPKPQRHRTGFFETACGDFVWVDDTRTTTSTTSSTTTSTTTSTANPLLKRRGEFSYKYERLRKRYPQWKNDPDHLWEQRVREWGRQSGASRRARTLKRDKRILKGHNQGYSLAFIANALDLARSTVQNIVNRMKSP